MNVGKCHWALALSLLASGSVSLAEDRTPENPMDSIPVLVPSDPITIENIQYNGTGCPLGTVAQNVSDDKQAFTLTFSEFFAEAGPGISLAQGRKNCIATVTLHIPSGWQYSVANFYYRGFMQLDEGIKADHSVDYSFEGQGRTSRFASVTTGPFENDYVYSDSVGIESNVWSPCGVSRALNLNTKIRVSNASTTAYPNARGFITNDSIDGQITQVFGLTWRRCS
ncbi:MAG TPA: DUF4360 domain-containing protein [Oligoflexus sp.]|uniref:DUF4360 domain-containing protein n=1 Tax=Oligoflexus sp. TaxID=1971216 RepID=UPI002D54B4BC|nr:DUF4360 domain-containing protein [Oligoflexus sp.]HYX37792.1 DUF4360 domain-containing protein [Oligoflexus sp.]